MNYPSESVTRLIECLDAAVEQGSVEEICAAVKKGMVGLMSQGGFELPAEFLRQDPDSYARHLLHKTDDYAVVIMVWGPGQGTPIHDHDEKWCVECVYSGTIKVTSYDLLGDGADGIVDFREATQVDAGKGMAGALIPPFDYHVIENATDTLAATIHVYGGEMHGCHTFSRMDDGRYQRQRSALSYTV
jgi:predicted metal-dependent enzyme (double-stranded beta helix superfamily)